VYANQTTLGADNGIAVAMILAIFADRSLKHGPLEALITSEEEIGMVGIQNFDIKKIHAKYLINLDNEDDQEVSIGCPGNIDVFAEIPFKRETKKNPNSVNLSIEISNGIGGHSGQTIGQKRVNAIQQIFNILLNIQSHIPLSLINVCDAGIAKNNIPPHAAVEINIKKEDTSKVKEILEHEFHTLKLEYHELEKDLNLRCFPSKTKLLPMRIKDSDAIISTLTAVPNGVHTFNWKYNVPETSSNLGLIKTTKNTVQVTFMVRSSYDHAQVRLANRIKALFKVVGGKAKETGFIPG
jgi:dipeptidase D